MPQEAIGGSEAPPCNADSTVPFNGYQPGSSGQDKAITPSSSVGDQSKSRSDQDPDQPPLHTDGKGSSDVPLSMINDVGAAVLDEVRKESPDNTVGDGVPSPQQETFTQKLDGEIRVPFSQCLLPSMDMCRLRTLTTSGVGHK